MSETIEEKELKEEVKEARTFTPELNEIEMNVILFSLNQTVSSLGTKDGALTVELLNLDAKLKSLVK